MPRGIVIRADKRNLRHEALVPRPVNQRSEEHQKPRHHDERRQKRKSDRFDQADCHIGTELELHEQHRDQTADGGKTARANLRNRLAERQNDRLADGKRLMFFFKAVAEDDRVVDGKTQLQDTCDGV